MALIKCNECGHEVSDKASVCPNCGNPIRDGHVCYECGTIITEGLSTCPNCGCPFNNKEPVMASNSQIIYKDPSKKGKGIFYIIGIVGYIILSVVACALLNPKNTYYLSYYGANDAILIDSLYCTLVASLLIFVLAKSWGNRIVISILTIIISFIWIGICLDSLEQFGYGTGILLFLIHFTFIIIAVYRRK